MGGISIWQLLIIAVIVILLFGTKKLRNLGGDLGSAVKGFKNAIDDDKGAPSKTEKAADTLTDTSTASNKASEKENNTQKENSQA